MPHAVERPTAAVRGRHPFAGTGRDALLRRTHARRSKASRAAPADAARSRALRRPPRTLPESIPEAVGGRTSPAEPTPATGAGTREAAASARLQASAAASARFVRVPPSGRRGTAGALVSSPSAALRPTRVFSTVVCSRPAYAATGHAVCRGEGGSRETKTGPSGSEGDCPTNLGPPPSSVPPAIREFSRRGGSRRVDKTCRTASARRPERSTPRGCSPRPRPARRPEALRAIWLRRRTPPRLRADRA